MQKKTVCLLPVHANIGGPAAFQQKLTQGLAQHGIEVHHDPTRADCAAILVVGGTHRLASLWRARRWGVRLVQRLDGMNWLHRLRPTGLRHYLRAEWYNLNLTYIRRHLADAIVYQSKFARDWWQSVHGSVRTGAQIIYNGVDLQLFSPTGKEKPPADRVRILLTEGNLSGGYEFGLLNALDLAQGLQQKISKKVELMIVGNIPERLCQTILKEHGSLVNLAGLVPNANIPAINRSAHMLFSADINAACPNAVVEALACGLPVIAYATGSLPELVQGDAGRVVPYGGNFWKLEPPNVHDLVNATLEILNDQARFRPTARAHAEVEFSLERMAEKYIAALGL